MYWNDASQPSRLSPVLTEILLQEAGTTLLIMALSDSQYIPPRNIIQTQSLLTIDCELGRLEHTMQRPVTNHIMQGKRWQKEFHFQHYRCLSLGDARNLDISHGNSAVYFYFYETIFLQREGYEL